jgi:POT family proton-dependent oligopeptide transporter
LSILFLSLSFALLTPSHFPLSYLIAPSVGALVGQIGMVYSEKREGFYLAFLLPTLAFLRTWTFGIPLHFVLTVIFLLAVCPIILWVGRNRCTLLAQRRHSLSSSD